MNSEYKSYTIGELCSYYKGLSIPRDNTSVDFEIPYLHYGDIYKKYNTYVDYNIVNNSIIKISASENIRPEQLLSDGDIVYNLTSETVDELGKSVMIINPNNCPFVAGMETTILKINNREAVSPKYLQLIFESSKFQALLRQFVTGMKVYRVHPRDLSKIRVTLPSRDIQEKIVEFSDNILNSMHTNSKINDYLVT